jgi:hypothetical protein
VTFAISFALHWLPVGIALGTIPKAGQVDGSRICEWMSLAEPAIIVT